MNTLPKFEKTEDPNVQTTREVYFRVGDRPEILRGRAISCLFQVPMTHWEDTDSGKTYPYSVVDWWADEDK